MITAKQARELTNIALKDELTKRQEMAKEKCEEIHKYIVQVAERGMSFLTTDKIETRLKNDVLKILKDNGFECYWNVNNTITIKW